MSQLLTSGPVKTLAEGRPYGAPFFWRRPPSPNNEGGQIRKRHQLATEAEPRGYEQGRELSPTCHKRHEIGGDPLALADIINAVQHHSGNQEACPDTCYHGL